MRKQSRRRIKIIVFFYLFLFFFLLNNPEFSHFRAHAANLQITCVHACTWLPGSRTRVISLFPLFLASVPCPPPPRSMIIALRTLRSRSSAETGKGKGHAMQLAVAVNDSEESKLRRGTNLNGPG